MKHMLITLSLTSMVATTALADPIHDASQKGDLAGVQSELVKGVDVNLPIKSGFKKGQTPLDLAVVWGKAKPEVANFIRKHGGKHSTIHFAVRSGKVDAVKEFLAASVNVNKKDNFRLSPLERAVRERHIDIVELLIANGADVNVKNSKGNMLLDYATISRHSKIADLLRK
ncbi:uncharacterized protein METZ01_LOCUS389862, partial [marine metagenome]